MRKWPDGQRSKMLHAGRKPESGGIVRVSENDFIKANPVARIHRAVKSSHASGCFRYGLVDGTTAG